MKIYQTDYLCVNYFFLFYNANNDIDSVLENNTKDMKLSKNRQEFQN